MTPSRPTLDLVRSATDELVLRALVQHRRLTRAGIAAETGISKPTASESVRRLTLAGVVHDTGERTTGRGRIGCYYGLAPETGCALVVSIAPEGLVAETLDVHADVVARVSKTVARPARAAQVADLLREAVESALGQRAAGPARVAVVSAADPVDRTTGRLVHLPDAPFLLGELDPVTVLAPLVDAAVLVDNDVNWAARAEREAAGGGLDDFAYVHLGEGLGCAVVSDGDVRRGSAGLAGELAHLVTTGAGGRARPLTAVFADLGLRQAGSTAIDVPALLAAVSGSSAQAAEVRDILVGAVCGVLAAVVALTDPSAVVLGGSWGTAPELLDAVARRTAASPRPVPVRPAQVEVEPDLAGARSRAVTDLQQVLLSRARAGAAAFGPVRA